MESGLTRAYDEYNAAFSPATVPKSLSRHLPPRPAHLRPVDAEQLRPFLEANDLADVPLPFVADVLTQLAPRLHAGCDSLVPLLPSPPSSSSSPGSARALPSSLPCAQDPLALAAGALPPTHLLAVSFNPSAYLPSSPLNVLYPIHALPWALQSPVVAALITPPPPPPPPAPPPPSHAPPPPALDLPVVRLALADNEGEGDARFPCPRAFALLRDWVVDGDLDALWAGLVEVHYPASEAEGSDGESENEDSDSARGRGGKRRRKGPGEARRRSRAPQERLGLVENLWRTCVALGVADEGVWEVMARAWEAVGDELRWEEAGEGRLERERGEEQGT
ncbi:hypothetical protein JCM10207_007552 [Rhodosporidiobolus poonsookiae]